MSNKRLLNYQFLKDLIFNRYNIRPEDKEDLLASMMYGCYCFSRLNFLDAQVMYSSNEYMVLSVYMFDKEHGVQEVSWAKTKKENNCIFTINRITKENGVQPVGKADLSMSCNALLNYMFCNISKEHFIHDELRENMLEISNDVKQLVQGQHQNPISTDTKPYSGENPEENGVKELTEIAEKNSLI